MLRNIERALVDPSNQCATVLSEPRFAVRPPELFPRLSYMALVDVVDEFVMADTFAYSRQSHHNRAPIRTPDGRMWLTVPLEQGSRGRPICDVQISKTEFDPGRLWRAIRFNYEATPFFVYFAEGVRKLICDAPPTLGALTSASVALMADALHIDTELIFASQGVGNDLGSIAGTREGRYVSSGDTAAHDTRLVDVRDVCRFAATTYPQAFEGFEADLSSLDIVMNWGPDALAMIREGVELVGADKGLMKPEVRGAVG
jgi:hypothetical protein